MSSKKHRRCASVVLAFRQRIWRRDYSGPHLLPAEPALDFPGETFRVLKEKEEKQFGEYRTRRLVLEAWERLHHDGLMPDAYDQRKERLSSGA